MESPAKRRKLDATGDASRRTPGTAAARPNPPTKPRAPTGRVVSDAAQTNINGTQPTSSHAAWREAKALSQARKGRKLDHKSSEDGPRGAYDDFEGAHTHQSPLNRVTPHSTPTKKHFDPLRNQQNAAQSPSPAKSRVSLDFFKQFSSPRSVAGPKSVDKPVSQERAVNGMVNHTLPQKDEQVEAGAKNSSEPSEDEEDSMRPERPTQGSAKTTGKGWSFEKPKKTFEDEIKELEDVARRVADQEEDDDTSQRRSGRTPKPTPHTASRDLAKRAKLPARQSVQPSNIREARAAGHRPSDRKQHNTDGDAMDIDEVLNGAVLHSHKAPLESEAISIATPTKSWSQPIARVHQNLKNATFSADNLSCIQHLILERLTAKRAGRLINVDDEYVKVSNLITQTITAGESNSMLVIGSRGSGKTAIVNQILLEQNAQHADDFHVVRLSGFVHTDDKVALREIWRQLGREMEMEGEDGVSKNYADTMTRLLALLSHPVEDASKVTKSVIFILDEFDLFAGHPRQTLLYNLFDIAQSRKAPIAVLGLTTRTDVAESLEKRVKSRFSHRHVYLSSAKSFAAFQDMCKSALVVDPKELTADERDRLGPATQLTAKLEKAVKKDDKSVLASWSAFVDELLSHENVAQHLKRIYYATKSVPEFCGSLLMPLATLPTASSITSRELIAHFTDSLGKHTLRPSDSKLTILQSLSTLQLALVICAARLTNIHNCDTVPFAQAYEEYKVLASKAKLQATASGALAQGAGSRVSSKDVAKGAWEDLLELGLIMEDGSRGGRVDVGLEEIGISGVELGSWGRWCREI